MSDDRKKPGVAFWATVALVGLPILYVLSFGPVCWITSRTNVGVDLLPKLYLPVILVWDWDTPVVSPDRPHPIHEAMWWYTRVGAGGDWQWCGMGADSSWQGPNPP